MKDLSLTRDEGERLVDLLEDCDPAKEIWRHDLAAEIRQTFGMRLQRTPDDENGRRTRLENRVRHTGQNLRQYGDAGDFRSYIDWLQDEIRLTEKAVPNYQETVNES
jgi:hypothetical protein